MSHDHDHDHDESRKAEPTVEPKQYWETKPARRAIPQYDPAEVARKFLDDMERGGRLHNLRKRA